MRQKSYEKAFLCLIIVIIQKKYVSVSQWLERNGTNFIVKVNCLSRYAGFGDTASLRRHFYLVLAINDLSNTGS